MALYPTFAMIDWYWLSLLLSPPNLLTLKLLVLDLLELLLTPPIPSGADKPSGKRISKWQQNPSEKYHSLWVASKQNTFEAYLWHTVATFIVKRVPVCNSGLRCDGTTKDFGRITMLRKQQLAQTNEIWFFWVQVMIYLHRAIEWCHDCNRNWLIWW